MVNWNKVDSCAKLWLREAGKNIIASFKTALSIHAKSDPNDLVTNIDEETEIYFRDKIENEFPGHRMLGEEGSGHELEDLSGVVWIVDPIDGTMNFVHQQRNFMISIGIYEDGQARLGYIYDVVYDELYFAKAGEGAYWGDIKLPRLKEVSIEKAIVGINSTWLASNRLIDPDQTLIPLVKDVRGTRSYGSAALEFAFVATGRLDAYITMRLSPWDFAGGKLIVEELGGVVTNIKGEPLNLLKRNSVVVAKPGLHEKIINDYLSRSALSQ